MFMYFLQPHWCPPRGAASHRPASGRSCHPGTSPSRAPADGSHGSAARSRCWYGCGSNARWENRSKSAFPLYNFLGHSLLSPFRMVCGNFILPEPACYVFFYAVFNLRNLLYIIFPHAAGAVSRDRNRTEIAKPRRKTGGAFGLLRKERDRISISAAGRISRAALPRARGRTRCVCGVRGSARGCAYAAPCTCGSPRRPRTGTDRRRRGSCP